MKNIFDRTYKLIMEAIEDVPMTEDEIKTHKPTILQVGENNEIISYGK